MHRSALFVSLFVLPSVTGCLVPQSRYDDAIAKTKVEHEERLKAEGELARVREDIARIDDILRKKEEALTVKEGELAQTKLDVDRESTEHNDAAQLVEQLRGELGRVGDHLRDFSTQKKELEATLTEAEKKSQRLERAEATVRDKVLVTRDLAYGLAEFVIDDKAVITAVSGKPAVRLDARAAFDKKGELSPEAKTMIQRIARAASPRSGMRVLVSEHTDEARADERTLRLARLSTALSTSGLAKERIDIGELAPPADGTVYPTPVAPGSAGPAATPAEAKPAAPPQAAAPAKPRSTRWQDGPGSVEITFEVAQPA